MVFVMVFVYGSGPCLCKGVLIFGSHLFSVYGSISGSCRSFG